MNLISIVEISISRRPCNLNTSFRNFFTKSRGFVFGIGIKLDIFVNLLTITYVYLFSYLVFGNLIKKSIDFDSQGVDESSSGFNRLYYL